MDDLVKLLDDLWHNIEWFLRTFSNEIIMFFLGGFGANYTSSKLDVELSRKQRWLRYLAGAVLAVLLPSAFTELSGYKLEVWSACLFAYISGILGVEGVTRLIVDYIKKNKGKSNDTDN